LLYSEIAARRVRQEGKKTMGDGEMTAATARAAWGESERQLYAVAVSDPSHYEQVILAVRAVADHLRAATSIGQLLSMWSQGAAAFDPVISATSPALMPFIKNQVVGAAFALREREIRELELRQTTLKRIEGARRSGDAWVLLDESGNLEAGLFAPYRSMEMHLPTGYAVISMVQQDPSLGTPIYVLAVVKLDPLSGELLDATPGIEDWREHAKREDFVAYRAALRDRIGTTAA
jgi:hypothetical protein